MALQYVNISTLLVLVAESGYDFQDLVNVAGAVNDPSGDKDKWNLPKVVQNGTFKSHLLDQFSSLNADTVSISACNKNGETLWTTHFNTTGLSLPFLDSLRGNNIIGSSAANNGTYSQSVSLSYNRYSTVIYPDEVLTNLAWLAVTNSKLIDDPHPLIFYARETSVTFRLPQIREGYEGCWPSTAMNVTLQLTGQTSGSDCASLCKSLNGSTVASISGKTTCNCGKYLQGAAGREDSNCYLTCDLRPTQICGGFGNGWYSNYYVPGTAEYINSLPELIYNKHFIVVGPDLQIDIQDLQPSTGDPAVVNDISVASDSESPYTIQYSDKSCGQEELKQYPITSNVTATFLSDGSLLNVGLIHVRCLKLHFNNVVLTADVLLYGPRGSYVKANALVVRASWLGEGTAVSGPSASSSPVSGLATSSTPLVTASAAPVTSSSSIPSLSTTTSVTSSLSIPSLSATISVTSDSLIPSLSTTTSVTNDLLIPSLSTTTSVTSSSSIPSLSTTMSVTSDSLIPSLSTTMSVTSDSLIPSLSTTTSVTSSSSIPSLSTTMSVTSDSLIPSLSTTMSVTSDSLIPSLSTTTSVTSDSLITPLSIYTPTVSVSPSSITTLLTYTTTTSVASASSITSVSTNSAAFVSSENTSTNTILTNIGITTNLPAQTTYPSPSITSNICLCDCRLIQHRSNLTDQELEAISVQIQRQLTVNKTELSSNIRKKTSASDNRTSAISIGIVGVALLVSVFGTIFVMDIPIILKDFVQLFKNLRETCSKSYDK